MQTALPRLSISYITRDEAHCIGASIASIIDLADEIVVADTGSTDHTVDIARSFGPKVRLFNFPWCDDFGAARTFSARQATGHWTMVLDADERLAPECRVPLQACLADSSALAFFVTIRSVLDRADPAAVSEMQSVRLYRRELVTGAVGRIHEQPDPPLPAIAARTGLKLLRSTVILQHDGFERHKSHQKLLRSRHLLELELADRPGRLYYQIEYGRTLLDLGDPRGDAAMSTASANLATQQHADRPPASNTPLLLEYILKNPHCSGMSAEHATALADRWYPRALPLIWARAQRAYAASDFAGCVRLIEGMVALFNSREYDRTISFDPRIAGEDAHLNLAACYAQLGQRDRAINLLKGLLASRRLASAARANLDILSQLPSTTPLP